MPDEETESEANDVDDEAALIFPQILHASTYSTISVPTFKWVVCVSNFMPDHINPLTASLIIIP